MNLHFNGRLSPFRLSSVFGGEVPEPQISYNSAFETKVRVVSVQFGDGYRQRALDGINTAPLVLNFLFAKRTAEEIAEIDLFLRGDPVKYPRTAEEYFFFTPPAPYGDRMRKFTCETWQVTSEEFNSVTLSGVMTEVFDP